MEGFAYGETGIISLLEKFASCVFILHSGASTNEGKRPLQLLESQTGPDLNLPSDLDKVDPGWFPWSLLDAGLLDSFLSSSFLQVVACTSPNSRGKYIG